MSPNASENVCGIIINSSYMSNQPINIFAENMKTLFNDIDKPPKRFVNFFEPIDDIRAIRFNQKMRRDGPLGRRSKEQTFPNSNDFNVDDRIYSNFLDDLKPNVPLVISKQTSNPTVRWFSWERPINNDLDRSHRRRHPIGTRRRALTKRDKKKREIQIDIWNRSHIISPKFFDHQEKWTWRARGKAMKQHLYGGKWSYFGMTK